jgi:hypothetical protein
MYGLFSRCSIAAILFCGVVSAQVPGAGGVPGGPPPVAGNGPVPGAAPIGPGGPAGDTNSIAGPTPDGVAGAPTIRTSDAATSMRQYPVLASMEQPLLPKGMNATQAASGFEDTDHFITALHAAHDMNIPFDQLKAQTTGKGHTSLEKASAKLRPDLDAKTVKENVKLAEKQSNRDVVQALTPPAKDSVSSKIASNTELASRAGTILPAGSNVTAAAAGFRDENQFLATAEASHSLNLPFAEMKDRVTAGQSLGDAIHAMKPEMSEPDAKVSAQNAASEAAKLRAGGNSKPAKADEK